MRHQTSFKCPVCSNKIYKSFGAWASHMELMHSDIIPDNWSPARYLYYIQTGKSYGNCVECKGKTEWNEVTKKYERYCRNPRCKELYVKKAKSRMKSMYGKEHLLNDPEVQRKMQSAKKTAGEYTFSDGGTVAYLCSYELDFLKMLDSFGFPSNDIIGPSPNTYYYDYENENDIENAGECFYIPDFFIPSLNLEIEIKSQTNMHHKIQAIDKVKEKQKDAMMRSIPNIRYIKLSDKQYIEFYTLLIALGEKKINARDGDDKKMFNVTEGYVDDLYIDDDRYDISIGNDIFCIETAIENEHSRVKYLEDGREPELSLLPGEKPYGLATLREAMSEDIFLISDFHITYADEPGKLRAQTIITNVNNIVPENANLLILGDLGGKRGQESKDDVIDFISKIKCKNLYLILGNHDKLSIIDYRKMGFKAVTDYFEWNNIVFSHIPIAVEKGMINVHGHNHGTETYINDMVSADDHIDVYDDNFEPKTLRRILSMDAYPLKEDDGLGESIHTPFATEGLLFKSNDIYYNIEDFESGKSNLLFITGHSGGGKTTLAYELGEKYNAEVFQIDWACNYNDLGTHPSDNRYGLARYIKDKGILRLKDTLKTNDDREKYAYIFTKLFDTIFEFTSKYPNRKFIVEGVQFWNSSIWNDKRIKNSSQPFIILGTSALTSYIRKLKRDGDNIRINDIIEKIRGEKYLNDERKLIKGYDNNVDEVEEALSEIYPYFYEMEMLYEKESSAIIDSAMESANSTDKIYQIFIVLQHGGITPLSKLIKFATGDEFTHAGISFNINLNPMYSFGAKEKSLADKEASIGFQQVNPKSDYFRRGKVHYGLFLLEVDEACMIEIQKRLKFFIDNEAKLKYDWIGIVKCFFNMDSDQSMRWFCSSFVSYLLGGVMKLPKHYSTYKPQDIEHINEKLVLIEKGDDFYQYDARKTRKIIEQMRFLDKIPEPITMQSLNSAVEQFVATEGYLFDNNEIYYKFDDYKNGKSNLLFITGHSGGGKTTLADTLSKKYNADVFQLDWLDNIDYIISESDSIKYRDNKLLQYLFSNYDYLFELPSKNFNKSVLTNWVSIYIKFINIIIDYIYKYKNRRVIVEGIHLYDSASVLYTEYDGMLRFPHIIVGTSAIKAFMRALKRDNMHFNIYDFTWRIKDERKLKKFRKMLTDTKGENSTNIVNEAFFDLFYRSNIIDEQSKEFSWGDVLFPESNYVGKVRRDRPSASKYTTLKRVLIDEKRHIISIQHININLLLRRIKETYGETRMEFIFEIMYNPNDVKRYMRKRISRSAMKKVAIESDIFFAMELNSMFMELYDIYNESVYESIAKAIYNNTWLKECDIKEVKDMDMTPLSQINNTYELKPHQLEFIQKYPRLKTRLNLKGYYLAFDQGLGKTLTAVALSLCLKCDHVYIVCPNSLKGVWETEIRKYITRYSSNIATANREVIVCRKGLRSFADGKFFITNNEAIPEMYPYVMNGNNMIIVDEMHNFRTLTGKRSQELFKLKELAKPENVLLMSGTPIKAAPAELSPALKMIDPLFTDRVAATYNRCFQLETVNAMGVVRRRFGYIMYRKTKEILGLPEKVITDLALPIANPEPYYMDNIRIETNELFSNYYSIELAKNSDYRKEFIDLVTHYSKSSKHDLDKYINWIIKTVNTSRSMSMHELDEIFIETYISNWVKPNIKKPEHLERIEELERFFIRMEKSCLGRAIGQIYPPRRTALYNALYDENEDIFINMIQNNTRKTVIFSQFLGVIHHISEALTERGIGNVKIVGETKNRMDVIDQFKYDDNIMVILATSQTLGTGVTLIEANQMFFFGPPWRSADYNQCCDRIYRIGQTSNVTIFNVILKTDQFNLSDKINKILSWSGDMFGAAIEESDLNGEI